MTSRFLLSAVLIICCSCAARVQGRDGESERPRWLSIEGNTIVSVNPFGSGADTLIVEKPLDRIVCMSSSSVGFLSQIGAESVVAGVSGLRFLSNQSVRDNAAEIGPDTAPDYETILRLKPDVVIGYCVSALLPTYAVRLKELGVPVLMLHEHLESHPLARAAYIRAFGLMTGRREEADSVLAAVTARYHELIAVREEPVKVLMNIPYADAWYIPGGDNFMTRLVEDAGGEVLGAEPGEVRSGIIHFEKALELASEADLWLHPGWCATKAQLSSVHPMFRELPVFNREIWNNTAQATPGGGNSYWETGPARPDLILEDLRQIITPDVLPSDAPLHYDIKVE